jgi:hypothetical protein
LPLAIVSCLTVAFVSLSFFACRLSVSPLFCTCLFYFLQSYHHSLSFYAYTGFFWFQFKFTASCINDIYFCIEKRMTLQLFYKQITPFSFQLLRINNAINSFKKKIMPSIAKWFLFFNQNLLQLTS